MISLIFLRWTELARQTSKITTLKETNEWITFCLWVKSSSLLSNSYKKFVFEIIYWMSQLSPLNIRIFLLNFVLLKQDF